MRAQNKIPFYSYKVQFVGEDIFLYKPHVFLCRLGKEKHIYNWMVSYLGFLNMSQMTKKIKILYTNNVLFVGDSEEILGWHNVDSKW